MTDRYYTVTFVSRNKDNKDVKNFKQRTKSYVAKVPENVFECDIYEFIHDKFNSRFEKFVEDGEWGELSRFYISVNERDAERAKKQFACELIMNDNFNVEDVQNKFLSVMNKPENAKTRRWMFDFDTKSFFNEFMKNLCDCGFAEKEIQSFVTINGYHIVVPHGFDTRQFLNKWGNFVEVKRDDLILYNWKEKR